jgi:curli biogenesis system outer membrane secretion channel CsgG
VAVLALTFTLVVLTAVKTSLAQSQEGGTTTAATLPKVSGVLSRRIAVLDFDDQAVRSSAQALFGTDVDVGAGLGDLLGRELAKTGTYSVVDYKDVQRIWTEQKLTPANRHDRETAVRMGKLLGVDGVVMGVVNQFGSTARRIGDEWIHRTTQKAFVEADSRLVDVATEEIVAVADGRGESSRAGTSPLSTGNGVWRGFGDDVADFGDSGFQQTLLGEAVKAAVAQLVDRLAADSVRLTGDTSTK